MWIQWYEHWHCVGRVGGGMCLKVCESVLRVFSKAPHSPNMFLSVHFTKTEEVVHDLTQPAPCRFVAPKNRLSTSRMIWKVHHWSQDTVFWLLPPSWFDSVVHTCDPAVRKSWVCTHSTGVYERKRSRIKNSGPMLWIVIFTGKVDLHQIHSIWRKILGKYLNHQLKIDSVLQGNMKSISTMP